MMGELQTIGAGLIALLAAAAFGLFKAWRGQVDKRKAAESQILAERQNRQRYQEATKVAEAARQHTEEAVETIRKEVRQGRRNHFEDDR